MAGIEVKELKERSMISFQEYFRVLLDGRPDEFIENYFLDSYPERYREFNKQLRALDESNLSLTDEMQEILEEIDDIDGGYGNVDDS